VYPRTQNFEIPLKTQESKKFGISFENFRKCMMAQNLPFWESLFRTFSDLENSKFS
jgi:hypothetical protein